MMAAQPIHQSLAPAQSHSRQSSSEFSVQEFRSRQNSASNFSMHSGSDDQAPAVHGRQMSRVGSRSRSGTVASSASSCYSQASTIAELTDISRQTSQAISNPSQNSLVDSTAFKLNTLFSRGRRIRRQSSKMSLSSAMDIPEEHEKRSGARQLLSFGLDKSKKDRNRQRPSISGTDIRSRISSPFDFQHVTHTDRKQLPDDLQQLRDNAIAIDSLHHPSHGSSRELNGIRASGLPFRNFSTANAYDARENAPAERSSEVSPQVSPLHSPVSKQHASPTSTSSAHSLRQSRSNENFSHPRVQSRNSRSSSAMPSPPPRMSSRMALTSVDDDEERALRESMQDGPASRVTSKRFSAMWDFSSAHIRPSTADSLATVTAEDEDFSHAVTTPGDSAVSAVSLPPPVEVLESVSEEPETQPPQSQGLDTIETEIAMSPRSLRFPRSSVAFLNTTRFSKNRPTSQMSDTLGPPFSPKFAREFPPSPAQPTFGFSHDFESWEEDVDYCYDHAAEAHDDYDWSRGSLDIQRSNSDQHDRSHRLSDILFVADEPIQGHNRSASRATRPTLFVPDVDAVPDLAPRSAQSVSTDPSIRTPSDLYPSGPSDTSPLPPHIQDYFEAQRAAKYNVMREAAYTDYMAELERTDRHYLLLDPNGSKAGSSRSSGTRLSKSSSYDDGSVITGSSSFHSSVRRSGSSSGSLPELIHSRSARRTMNSSVSSIDNRFSFFNVESDEERIPDQMPTPRDGTETSGSISSSNSDRTMQGACENQISPEPTSAVAKCHTAIDVEAANKDLQEAVPQLAGETISTAAQPHPGHERAASESATKLLLGRPCDMERSVVRKRSASSGQARTTNFANRAPLSLFPSTPKSPKFTT